MESFIRCTLARDKKYYFYNGKRISENTADQLIERGIKLGQCLSVEQRKRIINEILLGTSFLVKNVPDCTAIHEALIMAQEQIKELKLVNHRTSKYEQDIKQLMEEVSKSGIQLKSCRADYDSLKILADKTAAENKSVIDALHGQLQNLQIEEKRHIDRITELNNTKDKETINRQKRLDELNKQIYQLNLSLQTCTNREKELNLTIKQLEHENNKSKEEFSVCRDRADKLEKENIAFISDLNKTKKDISVCRDRSDKLEKENIAFISDLNKTRKEISVCRDKSEKENNARMADLEKIQTDFLEYKDLMEKENIIYRDKANKLEHQNNAFIEDLKQAQTDLVECGHQKEEYQDSLDKLKADNNSYISSLKQYQSDLVECGHQKEEYQDKIDKLEYQNDAYVTSLKQAQTDLVECGHQKEDSDRITSDIIQKMVLSNATARDKLLRETKKTELTLRNALDLCQGQISTYKQELNKIQVKLPETDSQEIDQLLQTSQNVQESLEEARRELEQLDVNEPDTDTYESMVKELEL